MIKKLPDCEGWRHVKVCKNPEHNPPSHIVLEPGAYEHTCPGCGHKTVFRVTAPTLKVCVQS
jgi:predicted RNA-binding Zn-ribbon protein involved in translation (DUF1610 family)